MKTKEQKTVRLISSWADKQKPDTYKTKCQCTSGHQLQEERWQWEQRRWLHGPVWRCHWSESSQTPSLYFSLTIET